MLAFRPGGILRVRAAPASLLVLPRQTRHCLISTFCLHREMAPKKRKQEAEDAVKDEELDSDVEEKPKKVAKPRAKKADALTGPTTDENGWTAHPPSLIYK